MRTARSAMQGFSLVEVTLALGVAAFCLVAIFGLLPIGVNSDRMSIEQTAAAGLAASVIADLRALPRGNPTSTQTSPRYQFPAALLNTAGQTTSAQQGTIFLREDGSATGAPGTDAQASANPRYRVTVICANPPTNRGSFAVPVRILFTWPALADPGAASAPKNFGGSYEVNTMLVSY